MDAELVAWVLVAVGVVLMVVLAWRWWATCGGWAVSGPP